jgi:L-alanine-DL-glutamate epimerase-like enolase superfamily enzyme
MGNRILEISAISSPLKSAFTISRGAKTKAETILVTLTENGATGRGESVPYARYGETTASVTAAIESARTDIESGLSREDLQSLMPPGAARCAVDCALWDLEAKLSGTPVWKLAGLPDPKPVETAVTVSLDTPDTMAAAAKSTQGRLLKLKLGGPGDLARIEAVHAARPDARLIVDANEGLNAERAACDRKAAAALGVVLIEQPFPAGADDALAEPSRPGRDLRRRKRPHTRRAAGSRPALRRGEREAGQDGWPDRSARYSAGGSRAGPRRHGRAAWWRDRSPWPPPCCSRALLT